MKGNHKNIFARDDTAWCGQCKKFISVNLFSKNKSRFNGLQNICKDHQKEWFSSPQGRAERMWQNLVFRLNPVYLEKPQNKCYKDVQLKITKRELLEWLIPELCKWAEVNPIETASLDRINSTKDYELGNLQIISKTDNFRKSQKNKRVHAPEGKSWCRLCKEYLAISEFYSDSSRFNKVASLCKNHSKQKQKETYVRRKTS